jgi:protein-S-isoprenylcysteine O-methyltransferase Ste14
MVLEAAIFMVGSIGITWISIPSLKKIGSHGFYRFFAWEILLGMFALQLGRWFSDPFSWYQLVSWFFLVVSLLPVIYGVILLRRVGQPTDPLEATTRLVTTGIYRLIRHPLYASLLLLDWGLFFKFPSLLAGCMAVVAAAFLYATACADEAECLLKFGEKYKIYMKKTKMFIPFVY